MFKQMDRLRGRKKLQLVSINALGHYSRGARLYFVCTSALSQFHFTKLFYGESKCLKTFVTYSLSTDTTCRSKELLKYSTFLSCILPNIDVFSFYYRS